MKPIRFHAGSLLIPFALGILTVNAQQPNDAAPGAGVALKKPKHDKFRTIDGTNNNVGNNKTDWGAANIALFRELPAAYDASDPNNAMAGASRPTPRAISNALCDEPSTHFNAYDMSMFFFTWGQFIDHDVTLTEEGFTEYTPIALPPNDPVFTNPIPFFRNKVRPGTGVTAPRDQTNLNTSWIDGSVVYGSDGYRAQWLRTHQGGKLKSSAGNLLPWNTVTGEQGDPIDPAAPFMANDSNHTVKTFVAGDIRASEQPGIMTMQTLFMREHNRICDRYLANGYTDDEFIYQKARKEVGAIIQSITYNEFLPAFGVTLPPYTGYKKWVRPDIANTFAAAAFRLGHTLVADSVPLRDDACQPMNPDAMSLKNVFFMPQLMVDHGVEPFLKGYATQKQFETDIMINSVLRNFLFGPGSGLDLASINIQRGRDHGLPDYNTIRAHYTGTSAAAFADITSDPARQAALAQLYGNVDNIDPWVGILSEDRMAGVSVGMTLEAILTDQITRLRDGDYYFYMNDPYLSGYLKAKVMHTRLSDVIMRNTSITSLQANVFFMDLCPGDDGEMRLPAAGDPAGIAVYPNPVREGAVTVAVPEHEGTAAIDLVDVSGRTVRHLSLSQGERSVSFDMQNLLPGVYLVRIQAGGQATTRRLVRLAAQ